MPHLSERYDQSVLNKYDITSIEYDSYLDYLSNTYIVAYSILDTTWYELFILNDLKLDVSTIYSIKSECRSRQIDYNKLRNEVQGYDFAYLVRENSQNVSTFLNNVTNKPADWIYSNDRMDEFKAYVPDTKTKTLWYDIIDGSANAGRGIVKGATMVITFAPSIVSNMFALDADALEYDYIYRQAYYEKYGEYPSAFSPLISFAKCSGEMFNNLGATMITGVYDSFINEDGSFNISGAQEFSGMMLGGSLVAAMGSVKITDIQNKLKDKITSAKLKDDIIKIDNSYKKGNSNNSTVNVENVECFTVEKNGTDGLPIKRYKIKLIVSGKAKNHLVFGEENIRGGGIGVVGCHNQNNFYNKLKSTGMDMNQMISPENITTSTEFPGLKEIKYKYPKGTKEPGVYLNEYTYAKYPKTVYDPNIYSDTQMFKWGLEAMRNGQLQPNGYVIFGEASNGMKFMGYYRDGIITNFFPVFEFVE